MGDACGAKKRVLQQRKRSISNGGVKKTRFALDATRKKRDQDTTAPTDAKASFKGVFAKDLGDMMFGYGDSTTNPVPETLDAVESIAVDFVRNIVTQCTKNVSIKGKIDVPDVQFVLRKDLPKAARAGELIIARDRTKRFKSVGKMEDFDPEMIEDALNVHS